MDMIETETRYPGMPLSNSRIIQKYPLDVGRNKIKIPECASILTAQLQKDIICLWVLDTPADFALAKNSDSPGRTFDIVGTGHPFGKNGETYNYISTVQLYSFVWHIFEAFI